jgi:hypothetical protein
MPGGLYSSALCRDSGWIQTVPSPHCLRKQNNLMLISYYYFFINHSKQSYAYILLSYLKILNDITLCT